MSDDLDTGRAAADVVAVREAVAEAARERSLSDALGRSREALDAALEQIDRVRDFVGRPESILGSAATKHGEIAEQVEVGVRNARALLAGAPPPGSFEGVGRTAATDYLIDGVPVQSKFINGVNRTLDHVLDHLGKHEGFAEGRAYYHVPKDQYATIEKALRGERVEGLADRTVQKIAEKVARIREASAGREVGDVIRPGVSDYAEVQQGRVVQTLDGHEDALRDQAREARANIRAEHEVGLGDAAAAVGAGALVGAALRSGVGLWTKVKERGGLSKLTADDWKELGLEAGKGGLQGGISAGALFTLTHATDLAAPFAGSVVSAAMGIKALHERRKKGEIDDEELIELSEVVAAEAAIVALATFAGQALIPIPALGAVVGALSGRVVTGLARGALERSDDALARALEERFAARMAELDAQHAELLAELVGRFDALGELTDAAFDLDRNVALRLQASVELAQRHGVPDALVLRTTDDLDAFMNGTGDS